MRSPGNISTKDRSLATSDGDQRVGVEEWQEESDEDDDNRTVAELAYVSQTYDSTLHRCQINEST